jgi:rhamnosyltransferase subunit B
MRVVIAVIGSRGDLNPRMAIGRELQQRGHTVIVATHADHRNAVHAAGLPFREIRPDTIKVANAKTLFEDGLLDAALAHSLVTQLGATFNDLLACCADVDLVLSSDAVMPAGLVAFARAIPWVHTVVTPAAIALDSSSAGDRGRAAELIRRRTRALAALCRARGISPAAMLLKPTAVLALFSPAMLESAIPKAPNFHAVGFSFYEGEELELDAALADFLNAGDPPVVFTFGSASAVTSEDFYRVSHSAAGSLGLRTVFLGGDAFSLATRQNSPTGRVFVGATAPYSKVFARARAIVHHGGIGTIARALRAGVPMVITPFFVDQPYNAAQAQRLGVARVLPRERYTVDSLTQELSTVLTDQRYAQRARQFSDAIPSEDGAAAATRIVETLGMMAS